MLRPAALLIVATLIAGCASPEEKLALAEVHHTPLAFDPTDEGDLGRWWSNGAQMLRLDQTGEYALYRNANRYQPPLERGSWARPSYAQVRLSPYDDAVDRWQRVPITKSGDVLQLHVRDLAPMTPIEAPPVVIEDDLIGVWQAADGTLVLGADLVYSFSPRSAASLPVPPAVVAGHSGGWRLEGEQLRLRPYPANMGAFELALGFGDDGTPALRSDRTTFRPATNDRDLSRSFPAP
ncbi:MAG: hypothetical protein HKN62_15005 [Phycisphaerales bacterium]|nr:hypothetical protein [Phycisphaerales bacterium]